VKALERLENAFPEFFLEPDAVVRHPDLAKAGM